jgi:hypothetical protein
MLISNTAPVVKPAVDEKVYPHIWVNNIQINTPNPTSKGRAVFTLSPYDANTGEMLENAKRQIVIKDLFDVIADKPAFQEAMSAILAAINEIK